MGFRRKVTLLKAILKTLILSIYANIVHFIPPLRKKFYAYLNDATGMNETGMAMDDWCPTFGGWSYFMQQFHRWKDEFMANEETWVGCPAPNSSLMILENQAPCRLLDYMKDERPLVVNFGSCS